MSTTEKNQYKISKYTRLYDGDNCCYVYNASNGYKGKIYEPLLIDQMKRLQKGELISEKEIDNRLIKAGLCLKEYLNEEAIIHDLVASRLTSNFNVLRLIILPTRECNFRCVYCYEEKRNEQMDKKTIDNLICATKKYLAEHNTIKSLQLEWFGGEPLLEYKTILEISSQLYEYCIEHDVKFAMSMTTNGYLLTKERAEELLKYNLMFYQITLDGFDNYHDSLRPLRNGNPTFKTIYSNLQEIKKIDCNNLHIMIRINYYITMLEDIDKFLLKLKNDFDDKFSFYMIKINPPQNKDLGLDFVTNKSEYIAQDHIFNLYSELDIKLDDYLINLNPLSSMCYARNNSAFVIDTDGTIRKCTEYLEDDLRNNLGNINDGYFNIDETIHAQWLYPPQKMLLERGCYDCSDLPLCYGGLCPVHWYREGNASCSLYHTFTDKMLKKYFFNKDKSK